MHTQTHIQNLLETEAQADDCKQFVFVEHFYFILKITFINSVQPIIIICNNNYT